jgi:hypothetical protein
VLYYRTFFQPTDFVNPTGARTATEHFSTDRLCEPNGGGCCNRTFFQPTDCVNQTGVGATKHFQPTDFVDQTGRVLLPQPTDCFDRSGRALRLNLFFNPPIHDTPDLTLTQKFQPTDFWIRNGVGAANQNFLPTDQLICGPNRSGCCYPKKISTDRPICGPNGSPY